MKAVTSTLCKVRSHSFFQYLLGLILLSGILYARSLVYSEFSRPNMHTIGALIFKYDSTNDFLELLLYHESFNLSRPCHPRFGDPHLQCS